jgi:mutator protein MutT
MYIKIYFQDKPLFLCDNIDETIQPYIHHDDSVYIDELDSHAVKSMIHEMQQPRVHAGVYIHNNLEELKKAFLKKFTHIRAAGGFIKNEKNELLIIYRKGKWDLPKGKMDKGETAEECVVREVKEETGLRDVQLIAPLTTTYHTYHEGSRFILKETTWFRMKADSKEELIPQKEEDINEAKWANEKELQECLKNSWHAIEDIVKAAGNSY